MSVQDKIERILKSIHLLFSKSEPYEGSGTKIIVEKQIVFELLEQLNLAIYEAMDQYELTTRKHEIAERRCEKRGEEILQKASRHADDIYAASIMYTDDAINRICYIMDDANQAVQSIFRRMNTDIEEQRDRVRRNQLELTGQLRDFADTDKYVKLIEEVNRQREKERQMELEGRKEKRIQNEGKSYSAVKPEIKINQAYFERTGKTYESEQQGADSQSDAADSLAHITGKEFAENLRRRAKRNRGNEMKIEDMSLDTEKKATTIEEREKGLDDILAKAGAGLAAMVESEIKEIENAARTGGSAISSRSELSMETAEIPKLPPEIHVDLDAEYFKWKEGEENPAPEKKEKRFHFGRK
ncbi:MAG: hypothetical protein HFH49_17290 [Lachnospiraceae bacterium]|nr:hypothetical protein [Lachnospiraceae bacterium]